MRSFRQNNVTHTDDDFLGHRFNPRKSLIHFPEQIDEPSLPGVICDFVCGTIATLAKYGQSYKNYVHLFSVSSSNNTPRIRESQSNE
ncbi:unnamed protein product [Rhizophagus irregularis]|nr:unnamed protein product [Rhizophagus irregularis]CAB4419536.1 unnamed protein product [Rhizophagus irregularis]